MERNRLYLLSFTELLEIRKHFKKKADELTFTDNVLMNQYISDIEEIDRVMFNKFHDLRSIGMYSSNDSNG